MNRIKLLGLALMAVFAFSAIGASVASALGPFYKVEGKPLLAGETRLLLASAVEPFTLADVALGQTITCQKLTLLTPDVLLGGLVGKSHEVIDFTECTQEGLGEKCEIEKGLVVTVPVLNLLGYSNANKTGLVLVLFEPKTGKVFATIKYTTKVAGGCAGDVLSQAVSGTVGALAQVNGKPVEVGSGTEALHGDVVFHKGVAKTVFVEPEGGGATVETKTKLELAGTGATLTGTALILVDLVLADGTRHPVFWSVLS